MDMVKRPKEVRFVYGMTSGEDLIPGLPEAPGRARVPPFGAGRPHHMDRNSLKNRDK